MSDSAGFIVLIPCVLAFILGPVSLVSRMISSCSGESWPDQWKVISDLLADIERSYIDQMIPVSVKDNDEILDRITSGVTFMNYFFNGQLSWQEQEIERIRRVFAFLNPALQESHRLSVDDFITFYLKVLNLINRHLNHSVKTLGDEAFSAAFQRFQKTGKVTEQDISTLGPQMTQFFQLLTDPGHINEVTTTELAGDGFTEDTAQAVFDILSCDDAPRTTPDYYASENTLLSHPIYRLRCGKYLVVHTKQILDATYKWLIQYGLNQQKDVYRRRDQFLETKVKEIFHQFFDDRAHIHTCYSVDRTSEQDILILYKHIALIVEVKAGNYREPLRDTLKAYSRIQSDFKKTIQYGYGQCLRVQRLFQTGKDFSIYDENGQVLYTIRGGKYSNVFSIVVTLERFGYVQSDLSVFLNLPDKQDYPWSIPVDDLETFLIMLKKSDNSIPRFIRFLSYRQGYHGHMYCGDEMEMCAHFLTEQKRFEQAAFGEAPFYAEPTSTHFFDEAYAKGLKLPKEIYWKGKKDGSIGHF